MPEKIKIGLLGGDKRQLITAECLSNDFECAVWGFSSVYGTSDEGYLKNTVRCADWLSAVKGSAVVVLPLPISADGVRLNCPLAYRNGEGQGVRILEICDAMPPKSMLLGGMIPPIVKRFGAERNIDIYDYYDEEELQIKNSVPTAEGAIASCIDNLPITILGMRAVVVGYGRVGRALATRLKLLGADVFVAARSTKDLSNARCDGCIPVILEEYRNLPVRCDAIFNTVPHCIFDRELLQKIHASTVIFELASKNAGVDVEAAATLGIRLIPLPSLPGRTSPVSAGEIICSVIREIIRKKRDGE